MFYGFPEFAAETQPLDEPAQTTAHHATCHLFPAIFHRSAYVVFHNFKTLIKVYCSNILTVNAGKALRKYLRISDGCSTDHHAVTAGRLLHYNGICRSHYIAISNHR